MSEADPLLELKRIADELGRMRRAFALVGGLAISVRGEVRFTRDVDIAVTVRDDADTEFLTRELRAKGYVVAAVVEHDEAKRLATVRLRSASGMAVDLLTASCGIEAEIVERAEPVSIEGVGVVQVARAEELLAMKVLSMEPRRLQDRIDAIALIRVNEGLDLEDVRRDLELIARRGYNRQQDLSAKLDELMADLRRG